MLLCYFWFETHIPPLSLLEDMSHEEGDPGFSADPRPPAPLALAAAVAATAGGLLLLSPRQQEDDGDAAGPAPRMPPIAAARMDLNADGMDMDVGMHMGNDMDINQDDDDDDDMGMPPLGGGADAATSFPGGIAVPLDMAGAGSGEFFPGIGGSFESLPAIGGGSGFANSETKKKKKKKEEASPPLRQKARCAVPGCPKQSQGAAQNRMCRTHFHDWLRDEGEGEEGSSQEAGTGIDSSAEKRSRKTAGARRRSRSPAKGRTDGPSPRNRCSVPGCPKQSQGHRCGRMCAAHFKLYGAEDDDKDGGNSSRASGSRTGGILPKARCSVPGCPKQSQGGRCGFMCAAHYNESRGVRSRARRVIGGGRGGEGQGEGGGGTTTSRRRRRKGRRRSDGGFHALCQVRGCPKQSQGGRRNFMCAAHFRQYGEEGPPPNLCGDSDNDDDSDDGDDYSGDYDDEEEYAGDEYDYERNNGYYHDISPNVHGRFPPFVGDKAVVGRAADAFDPALMHSMEGEDLTDHLEVAQAHRPAHHEHVPQQSKYHKSHNELDPVRNAGANLFHKYNYEPLLSPTTPRSRGPSMDLPGEQDLLNPMPPLGASVQDGQHDGQPEEECSTPALGYPEVFEASAGVTAMEATRRGDHWGQRQFIYNSRRNGGKKGLLDRRRQAEVEMERAKQFGTQQPQQDGVLPQQHGVLPPSPLALRHTGGIPTEVQCRTPIGPINFARNSINGLSSPDQVLAEFVNHEGQEDLIGDFAIMSPGPNEALASASASAATATKADDQPPKERAGDHNKKDQEREGCWELSGETNDLLGDALNSPLLEGTLSRASSDGAPPQRLSLRNKAKAKKEGGPKQNSTLPLIDELNGANIVEGVDGGDADKVTSQSSLPPGRGVSRTMSRTMPRSPAKRSPSPLPAQGPTDAVKSQGPTDFVKSKADPLEFDPNTSADIAASSTQSKPLPSPKRLYGSPKRAHDDDDMMLSPSQRRRRRLNKHIEHAKKAASPRASAPGSATIASPSASAQEEEREHVDFAERLSRVNLTTEKGPKSPHHLSSEPRGPLLRHSRMLDGSGVPFFGIQNVPPPRRVGYRNQKSLQKQSDVINSSLTTLGPSAEGSIHFEDTLGRSHIAEDSDCGFRWFPEGSTVEEFVASEFVGYNQGLGRAYFKSFYHRGRQIEVGNFVKKRFGGTIEYYRIAGAFQACVSFLGDWEDGTFPPAGKRIPHKGEIQKRGHPYVVVVPLKLKSDVVSGKARKKLKKVRRRPSQAASDSESDAGFTSCDSDDGGGGRLGITNKKRRLPQGSVGSSDQGEPVEQELVLTNEDLEEPNNIFVLPMWLGEPSVTFETFSVRCKSEKGEDWIVKATDHGGSGSGRKRHRALNEETFVCRQAVAQSQWAHRKKSSLHKKSTKKKRRDLKEPKATQNNIETEEDGLLTKHLADEQFQLLTAKPKELLEDFIPPQWAFSFNACRTQFVSSWEERPWYDDAAPELDFFPNPYGSSDDSDGFDEESNAFLRGDIELAVSSEDGQVLDFEAEADTSKDTIQKPDAKDIESDDESMDVEERTPAPDIGEGWTMTKIQRKGGLTGAKKDRMWHSPCGQEFRSIVQVKRFKAEQARQLRKSSPRKKSRKKSLEPQTKPSEPKDGQPESLATDLTDTGIQDTVDGERSVGCITVDDLKQNTEVLYAGGTSHRSERLTKSTMIKLATHLQKVSAEPSLEEALPQIFLHTANMAQNSTSRSGPRSTSSRAVPRYVVERKDSTQQIASRVAYLMQHRKGSNLASRPKALCYCLKAAHAKTMASILRRAGLKAQVHSVASNKMAKFASGTTIDVLCLESDSECESPYVCVLSQVCSLMDNDLHLLTLHTISASFHFFSPFP